jgi:uncharacterized membrane protein
MKKLFACIIFIGFCLASFAQDSLKLPIPDSTKLTFTKVYNDVKGGLSGLAAGLKTGVSHVYEVLVKQQVVNAVIFLLVGIFSIIFFCITISNIKKSKWGSSGYSWSVKEEEFNKNATMTIIFGIFFMISLIVTICNLDTIVGGFINPEYGAIKEIISFIK